MMIRDRLLKRVGELIAQGNAVLATRHRDTSPYMGSTEWVDVGKMSGFRVAVLSFIERTYRADHPHYTEFNKEVSDNRPSSVQQGLGILESIRGEIAGDWLFSIKGLVTAEVFSDFIDMANYLMEQDYKDAAAVIAGSVLEEHLRQLCRSNGVDIEVQKGNELKPKKADTLNSDLAAVPVYSKLDLKAVTFWLDLRNKAAHGHYSEYTKEQVQGMISGITEFMARVPA